MTSARQQYPPFQLSFRRLKLLGEGSFGKVYLGERLKAQEVTQSSENKNNSNNMNAQNHTYNLKESHREFYALKKLKPYARKKYIFPPINNIEDFPEVVIMKKLSHPNILELKGIAQYDKGYELNHYLVIDFGIELLEFVKHKEISLSKQQIRCLVKQIVNAILYLHSQGIMHRDIKPDNIYLMKNGVLKLGDFSISTSIKPPSISEMQEQSEEEGNLHTANVTTRHYRAPEVIFGSRKYTQSIDMWSLGCTIVELLLGQTLFPGTTDIHQLDLIFAIIGCPQDLWPEASQLPYYLQFDNSKQPAGLRQIIPNAQPDILHFLENLLQLNPLKRMSINELIHHPYLQIDTTLAEVQLAKICSYLHQKKLREMLKK